MHPDLPWCRYADDGGWFTAGTSKKPWHSRSRAQARLAECRLEMHPTKTKIVYCKDGNRKGKYPNIQFDFLGPYGFRPRLVRRSRDNTLFWGFNPAVSASALKAMRAAIRELNLRHRTDLPMDEIARQINPLLRELDRILPDDTRRRLCILCSDTSIRCFWPGRCGSSSASRAHKIRTSRFLQKLAQEKAGLFVHWQLGHDRYVRLMGAV